VNINEIEEKVKRTLDEKLFELMLNVHNSFSSLRKLTIDFEFISQTIYQSDKINA
jgi:hypothetical protein